MKPKRERQRDAAILEREASINARFANLAALLRQRLREWTGMRMDARAVARVAAVMEPALVRETARDIRQLQRTTSALGSRALADEIRERLGRAGMTIDRDTPEAQASRDRHAAVQRRVDMRGRLRRVRNTTATGIVKELGEARAAGESAIQASRRIERVAGAELQQRLPRFVRELRDAARSAPQGSAVREAVERHRSALNRNATSPEFSMRRANKELLREIQRASAADIDAVIERWVEKKAAYRARVIARTEGQRAFAQSYIERAQRNRGVVAFRWVLSPSHPRPDICDVHASFDGGYGPGTYPKDSPPVLPAHPNCICSLRTVLVDAQGRAPARGAADADLGSALERLPESTQRAVLGPRRFEALRSGQARASDLFRPQEGWGTQRVATVEEVASTPRRRRRA